MKIGVITDCFKLPLADSIKLAGELGFDGIQVYATTGEFSPEVLSEERKNEIKALLKENNLEVFETIVPISARLIANKTSFRFKSESIEKIVSEIAAQTEAKND